MNRVKELRLAAGMQQKELALNIGVRQPAISDWERQKADPTSENVEKLMALFKVSREEVIVPPSKQEWNVEYPAGVALRTVPTAPMYQTPGLSEHDLDRIAEKVANLNRDAKTTPVLNQSEQQLIEEYRLLNTAGRIRVQRLIGTLLDAKYNEE